MSDGKVFYIVGTVTENLGASVLVLDCGTLRRPWSDDLVYYPLRFRDE